MNYFLAIDGGGTKTQVVCADENGEIVGEGLSGPTSLTVASIGAAGFALREAIRQATQNLPPGFVILKLVMGLAGIDTPEEKTRAETAFKQVLFDMQVKEYVFLNDVFIALKTATNKPDAISIISGTGSNCFGINSEGQSHKTGGLDFLLSDEGSGYAIGLAVLKAAAQSFDGRSGKTLLENLANSYFETTSVPNIKHHIYNPILSKMQVAALAKLAFDAMDQGDQIAKSIIDQNIEELFLMAKVVIEALNLHQRPADCVFSGRVLLTEYVKQVMTTRLTQAYPQLRVIIPEDEPVYGALKLALQK